MKKTESEREGEGRGKQLCSLTLFIQSSRVKDAGCQCRTVTLDLHSAVYFSTALG